MRGQLHRILQPESIRLLVAVFGAGQSVKVPFSTAHAERFEVIIGLAETSRLVEEFGGSPVYLPGLPPADGRSRGPSLRLVDKLTRRRKSAREIALAHGCSARTIYNKRAAIKRLREEGRWK